MWLYLKVRYIFGCTAWEKLSNILRFVSFKKKSYADGPQESYLWLELEKVSVTDENFLIKKKQQSIKVAKVCAILVRQITSSSWFVPVELLWSFECWRLLKKCRVPPPFVHRRLVVIVHLAVFLRPILKSYNLIFCNGPSIDYYNNYRC